MIKFPTTISEYTDGKLWYHGVDESIARRILVDLHKIEDKKELDLRKMYLAHFYCKKGEYRLAMTLAKSFLLENILVNDALLLMKNICVLDKDADNLSLIIRLMDKIYHGKLPSDFFEDVDIDFIMPFDETKCTSKGQVVYKEGIAEYYQNDEHIFSVKDVNYEALIKDSAARYLLSENQPDEAVQLILSLNLAKLKGEVKTVCHQTMAVAYCMMRKYDEAYEYCELLIDKGIYIPEMTDVLHYLYEMESPNFSKLREFLIGYKGYENVQLGDLHSLAKDMDDDEFWYTISKNNPLDVDDKSEETYLFRSILAFNQQDYRLADSLLKQATSLYGRFGKAWIYRYFVEYYLEKVKTNPTSIGSLPQELFTSRIEEVYSFVDKKLFSKLKKCESREDFVKKLDDNMLELDNMLSAVAVKPIDLVNTVSKVYGMNYAPACDLINRVAIDEDYNLIVRAICLANFLIYGKKKNVIVGKYVYSNPFVSMSKSASDGSKFNLMYGCAIYTSLSMLEGIFEGVVKDEAVTLKKIYSVADGDYSDINPLAIFGVILAYFNEDNVHYDKYFVKKREVKAFAQTFLAPDGAFNEEEYNLSDEDILDFVMYCTPLA